jgi:metal-sulfur cluster biosynthetic enzyme
MEPTVNANPTILAVDASSSSSRSPQHDDLLHAWTRPPTNPTDQAVQQAFRAAQATAAGGLKVLEHLGVRLSSAAPAAEAPFVFSPTRRLPPSSSAPRKADEPEIKEDSDNTDDDDNGLDADEVFDIIRNIQDPEHPLTLEQLGVVSRAQIVVTPSASGSGRRPRLRVRFTPTIPHCSMATQIGLCLRTKLDRSLPTAGKGFQTTVQIEPGTHASEAAINKQLADKERVCAALENKHLLGVVNRCIMNGITGDMS